MRRFLQLAAIVAVAMLPMPGCVTEFAAEKVIAPPNGGQYLTAEDAAISRFIDDGFRVTVGPPDAELMVWVVEPKRADVFTTANPDSLPQPAAGRWSIMRTGPTRDGVGRGLYQLIRYRTPGTPQPVAHREPRGTILILQGYSAHVRRNAYLWPWAGVFADAGYRVIMPDLRGHGDSTGGTFTWGAVEVRDLIQLVDELDRRGLLAGKLGVFGHSTGASLAIAAAAHDDRVAAVVAVSPWVTMRQALSGFRDWKLPWLGWLLNEQVLDAVAARAGRRGGFDPAAADAAQWIRQTSTPVLLLHGASDPLLSPTNSRAIYRARPEHTQLVIYPGDDHWSLMEIHFEDFRRRALQWMDGHLLQPPVPAVVDGAPAADPAPDA